MTLSDATRPLILLTNDDGIRSPGLWAAAEALSAVGYVTVAAPREQSTGMGRSMPTTSDGAIHQEQVSVGGKTWTVYAVGGTPAQAVQHAIFELTPRKPDLVVAGINYGENLTTGISVSGTIGAALEGAVFGIPSLAISQETDSSYFLSYSKEIDFGTAGYFTAYFARLLLAWPGLPDVHVLDVNVPLGATPKTPWRITRLSHRKYYVPIAPKRERLDQPGTVGYKVSMPEGVEEDSDVHALRLDRLVSVTPLSLDSTSRVDRADLTAQLRRLAGPD
ncbi:MAG: 5'/3'-nucleotidase SurE [Chloroflexi bacterium]|nr:5'/3'-nucleotidase SurE [Chloroflexota bacterium]